MKLTIKYFILLFFIANTNYAQEWVKTDITEFASIDFPVSSEHIETGQETVYNVKDDVALYIVTIRKLTDQQTSQISKDDIPTIYQGVVNGTLEAANAELISINEINIQGFPAVELEYRAQSNPELPSQRFKKVIYLNKSIISIDFLPLNNQMDVSNEMKEKFFNSFSITSNEVEQTSTTENSNNIIYDTSYKTGYIVAQIVSYLILIGFIVGIVLLIRYLIRKNRKKKKPTPIEKSSDTNIAKVICQNCNTENRSDTKYCSTCGYELKKT